MQLLVSIPLWAEVVYVAGTVNGETAVWTKSGDTDWAAVVTPSGDGMYYVDIAAYDELGRATPFNTTLYYSYGLTWKINWRATDNWARRGIEDCARLWYNYTTLRDELVADFGFSVAFDVPALTGYETEASAAFLNAIETAMNALRVFPVPWNDKIVTWLPGARAPNYEDVNRWESNGREIELAMRRARTAWAYSGEMFSGEAR
jgi:hypothetical protein